MPCFHPLPAFKSENGSVSVGRASPGRGTPFFVPCGQCIGCRLERSRQWAVRLMHERSFHLDAAFLTLTYDDDHLPSDHSLSVDHFQRFMKRYRRSFGQLRFFACGEYGEANFRPHYHAIIFGHDFSDKIECTVDSKNPLYVSPSLARLWPYGNHKIGAVSFESAAYVARYCTKKVTGEAADSHYSRVVASTGECVQVAPEFALMSRKPGIGSDWFLKFNKEVYPVDRVVTNGVEAKPPRAYDKLLSVWNPKLFEDVKFQRELKLREACNSFEEELKSYRRLPQREEFAKLKQKTFSSRNKEF